MEDILMQIKKYMRRFPQLDYASRQKIYAHFARKGYNSELIREAMTKAGELLEEESDTEKIPMERGVYLVKVDNRTIRVQVR